MFIKFVSVIMSLIIVIMYPAYAVAECIFREPNALNPSQLVTAPFGDGYYRNHFIMDTNSFLFERGSNGVVMDMAKSYNFNVEKKLLTIKLDKTCAWSDGVPITANDFVKGLQIIFDPKNKIYLPSFDIIRNSKAVNDGSVPVSELAVRAIDAHTLELQPNITNDIVLAVLSLPIIAPAPTHKINEDPNYWNFGAAGKISSGPYVWESRAGAQITLVPNPYYCHNRPRSFDRVIIEAGIDDVEAVEFLNLGVLDFIPRLEPDVAKALRRSNPFLQKFNLISINEEILDFLTFSRNNKAMRDLRVRRALILAIDWAFFGDRIDKGALKAADSYSYRYPSYNPPKFSTDNRPYNEKLTEARALLKEAGYDDHHPLKFQVTSGTHISHVAPTRALMSMISQLPIKAEFKMIKDKQGYFLAQSAGNFAAYPDIAMNISSWGSDFSDPVNTLEFLALFRHPEPVADARIKELFSLSKQSNDQGERFKALEEVERIFQEESTIVPLLWTLSNSALRKNFHKDPKYFYYLARTIKDDNCTPK